MARKDVDMVVVQSSGGNHESVRMESCSGDRSGPVAEETRVGLEVRNWLSVVDVEYLDTVLLSSTASSLAAILDFSRCSKLTLQRRARARER